MKQKVIKQRRRKETNAERKVRRKRIDEAKAQQINDYRKMIARQAAELDQEPTTKAPKPEAVVVAETI